MSDAKKSRDGKKPSPPGEPAKAKGLGFGEFAEVYRARWIANHPHMRRTMPGSRPLEGSSADESASELDGTNSATKGRKQP